jgi:diguanylate cyclase (GGDEF)-like protein
MGPNAIGTYADPGGSRRGRLIRLIRAIAPGDTLAPEVWERRHRWLLRILWAHACALPPLALALGYAPGYAIAYAAPVTAVALLARFVRGGHRARGAMTALGFMTCSAVLVHMTHGQIEAHFHFFVMVALLTLYEDWGPLLVSLGYVVLDRGMLGLLDGHAVYQHSRSPSTWAAVHVGFVAVAAGVTVIAERLHAAVRAEQRAGSEELLHLASHDALTGLANRELLTVRLRAAVAELLPGEGLVAVLDVDLDNFKLINDAFGHDEGDRVIVEAAARVRSQLRVGDTLGRIGGDEFIAVCRAVDDRSDAHSIAARISRALDEPFVVRGHTRILTCSVGVAVATSVDDSPDDLIRTADAACHQAKANGRSRIQIADDQTLPSADHRLAIERDLQLAVQEKSLSLHYQPIVDLRTGAVFGVEALVRWEHPTRGMIPAAEFIPVAETAGLSVPLGQWVLHEACAQAARWRFAFPRRAPLKVFANVSPSEVTHPTFLATVRSAVAEAPLAPGILMLELTEHALMEERGALEALVAVQKLGVGIVLDDFGKGHSSLSHLASFPVEVLKLDKSFVSGDRGCEGPAPILDAVVRMAGGLSLPLVAEGIETASQLQSLRAHGFVFGQGYYFMRPEPAEALIPLLAEARPFAALLPGSKRPALFAMSGAAA